VSSRDNPRTLRIACVGHASVDHVFEIDAMPSQPTKTLARRYETRAGGMSLHAAIAAARLGATVRLLGRVGADAAADFLRARLDAEGVQSRGLESVAGANSSLASVIVDAQGARQIFIHRGDALARAHALDTRQLEGADLVLTDPRWPEGAAAALRWARERGVPSLLDADVAPPEVVDRLLPLARWVAFSEPGLASWARGRAHDTALRAAHEAGPMLAVVTLGADGARYIEQADPSCARHVAAPPVSAVDTTGAGDVFHAALAIALAEQRPVKEAVAWACLAAAFKCERGGGNEGAPTRRELQRWMALRTPQAVPS
jgi:sulfofructose kinase